MKRGLQGTLVRGILAGCAACMVIVVVGGFGLSTDNDYFLKINKSIDVFGRVYKEIAGNYVDEVDPEKFMHAGIEGMLGTLDPYTVYIDKEDGDEVDLLTTGKYGGIGVTIGQRDGAIQIISVMDGYSAQRQGIIPGDRIVAVDGTDCRGKKPDEVRALTRGEPGTEVKVTVEREGEQAALEFMLIREEIQVKNVTYSGFVRDGIGYIRLERFSRKAGDEVRQAIKELKVKGQVSGLVLDLRGNPGGLLDAAVDVVSKFVPRGSLIVSTKGRRTDADRQYTSVEEPLLPDVPMAVIADHNSASASEIVAGALQDLDRSVIVGTRTFGKGLVQTIVPLNYGAQLKITTARYYTPSGRCIQVIDYIHKDNDGVFVAYADSLKKEFKTAGGRTVYEHGGIAPDSSIEEPDSGPMVRELYRKSLFFKFSNTYVAEHKGTPIAGMTDDIMDQFRKFLDDQKFDYQENSEAKVAELSDLAGKVHYGKDVVEDLARLKKDLELDKRRGFERYSDHIRQGLTEELMARARGEQGRIEASLQNDVQLEAAVALLKSPKLYQKKTKM